MKIFITILLCLSNTILLYSMPDTISIRLFSFKKEIKLEKKVTITISQIDGMGNKLTMKPHVVNNSFICNLSSGSGYDIKFKYGKYNISLGPNIRLTFSNQVVWTFGIDTAIDNSLYESPEFIERLPVKHCSYYLNIDPDKGIGGTFYKFINFKRRRLK